MKILKSRILMTVLMIATATVILMFGWPHLINLMLPADSRPAEVEFESRRLTPAEFEALSVEMQERFPAHAGHIVRFREAGILEYRGPETCIRCHETIRYEDPRTGKEKTDPLMENLLTSVHYRFYSKRHPNVYGFNGKLADRFPMGKINRPCPKPGSFAMTAWCEVIITADGKEMSEGCGQCHIGGQHQAPLGDMMPFYRPLQKEQNAIDCLICHSPSYDMNRKEAVTGKDGRNRWGQDRSMKAALTAGTPTSQACLRCHQHNFGGDIYIDEEDPSFMESLKNTGKIRPRVLHPGSKRGTPFSPAWDVHAAAGISCIDCHTTAGHHIAKGTHTTTMMANDLPDVEVTCEKCHTAEPHESNPELAGYLNGHVDKIACQTCHIPSLHPDNVTRRDFGVASFEEHEGIFIYSDIQKKNKAGEGIRYVWWNGDATFLGNPIGDNPNGKNLYRFYDPADIWPEFAGFDYAGWYEKVMRPIAKNGRPSKLYAMKVFNGRQHIDLQNIGPFGGMFVPYNLPVYYRTGRPDQAAAEEMNKSMMKRMYGWMFKVYMLDRFMSYMDVERWNTGAYEDVRNLRNVEARWMPNDAMMEISHAIRLEGALTCADCHAPDGLLNWEALGYDAEEAATLRENPL